MHGISRALTERQSFQEKFCNPILVENWERLPTSASVEIMTARITAKDRLCRVLDLCCGTGKGTIALALNGAVSEITYVDQSVAALEMAREVIKGCARHSHISTQFVCQPAEDLNIDDFGMFDAIVIRYAFHLLHKPDVVLSRLYKMLRPGGRIVFNLAGSNIFRFADPSLNAVPDDIGRAHPFFRAVYTATAELKNDILLAVPTDKYEKLVAMGNLVESRVNTDPQIRCTSIQLDLQSVMRIVVRAGIPISHLSFELTWFPASYDDKAAYATAFGSPPIPGIWNIFNEIEPVQRAELVQRIMQATKKILPDSPHFYFPEPLFTITRN